MTAAKTVAFSRDSTNLFFHILTRCNLNCRHCYINTAQHGKNTLPLSTINTWLEAFSDNSRSTNLIFLGGEPTLHPDLPAAVSHACRLGFASITIDTNGYLFNDILAQVEPAQVDYFSFSLDGATRQTNDTIRGRGSFETCLAGIRKAAAKGFATSMIYTVSRANIDELVLMEPLLISLGVRRFFIQVIGLRGRSAGGDSVAGGKEQLQVSKTRWLETIPGVARKIAGHGITVTYPKVYLNPTEKFECAGRVAKNYFIFPNGRVYRCPLCEDYPIHSLVFKNNRLVPAARLNETDFFKLDIAEGCVMNKLIQPDNLHYHKDGTPEYKI
ncbi:MAG: heme biosynthesis protein, partial [Desulfobacca sp. 4484_104]